MRRRRGVLITVVGAVALALLCCGGGVAAFLVDGLAKNASTASNAFGLNCGRGSALDPNAELPRAATLTQEQMRNAAIVIAVGQRAGAPPRGWVIAVATALQESDLVNLGHRGARNDHDSLGLFQQRPSMGWGTPEQLMDPEYASRKFYEKLLTIPNWQSMSLMAASQAVQRSAYPNAYAKHEPLASLVVNLLTDGAARAVGDLANLTCVTDAGQIAASGWTVPIDAPIVSGFRTAARPTHNGVDFAARKGTPIHATAAGVVDVAMCNASTDNCNVDGSVAVRGCGWYVDVRHAGNVITRYCHMVSRPEVSVGQQVVAGQILGQIGSSGNSSGPHLHFEVHLNGDSSSSGAVDPVMFMSEVGAPLGAR